MKKSWNTWNVRSVLSHVHLPEGIAISLGIKNYNNGQCQREMLIGRDDVIPGPHAYDGSYTCLTVGWHKLKMRVETAVEEDEHLGIDLNSLNKSYLYYQDVKY